MSDLAGWLLEQIAADEAVARAAQEEAPTPWWDQEGTLKSADHTSLAGYAGEYASPHIARHDPARVLAECEAQRRIVEKWQAVDAEWLAKRERRQFDMDAAEDAMWFVMKALAAPYADRSGYREEWKP